MNKLKKSNQVKDPELNECPICAKGRKFNKETIKAIKDAQAGRTTKCKDLADMFRKLNE